MKKIAWLTQYNISKLSPEIKLSKKFSFHNSSWIHNLSEELVLDKDIELHIITHSPYLQKSESILKNGIHFHLIKYSFPFTSKGFPWYLPIDQLTKYYPFAKKAIKIINEIQPEVLHVHGTEGGYFAPASRLKIPCVVSIQGLMGEIVKLDSTVSGYFQMLFEHHTIKSAKYFGCRTDFDNDYVKKINKEAIIFDLPEAINKVFFEKKWEFSQGINLLFVGSILWRKGIEDLIQAVNKLRDFYPDIHLSIIGSGEPDYINYLKKLIEKFDLATNITFLGQKSASEISLELTKCNFFILPSVMENSPNCLAEAMAVGVPCIATKVGGIPSMIKDGNDGLLFEKHNIDDLVYKILDLAENKELQIQLSENARARSFARNYPSKVSKKYLEVYNSLSIKTPINGF